MSLCSCSHFKSWETQFERASEYLWKVDPWYVYNGLEKETSKKWNNFLKKSRKEEAPPLLGGRSNWLIRTAEEKSLRKPRHSSSDNICVIYYHDLLLFHRSSLLSSLLHLEFFCLLRFFEKCFSRLLLFSFPVPRISLCARVCVSRWLQAEKKTLTRDRIAFHAYPPPPTTYFIIVAHSAPFGCHQRIVMVTWPPQVPPGGLVRQNLHLRKILYDELQSRDNPTTNRRSRQVRTWMVTWLPLHQLFWLEQTKRCDADGREWIIDL